MHRSLVFATAALAFSGLLATAPAFAQNGNPNAKGTAGQNAQEIVRDATQTVHQLESHTRLDNLLKQSKGVFIMPNLVTGAFFVGGSGAQGVLLKHNADGTWSDPAFLTISSVSIGPQGGGKAGSAAMILMTHKALNDFIQANNFSLNANAGLTVVNYSTQGQIAAGKSDVIIWSSQRGAFGGANVSVTDISQNTNQDREYYGKQVSANQILANKVASNNPATRKLRTSLPG